MEILTSSLSPLAQELQALKVEIHRTIARLSAKPSDNATWPPSPRSPWSRDSASSPVTTTTTTTASPGTLQLDADSHEPTQSHVMRELIGAMRHRSHVEAAIARNLEQDPDTVMRTPVTTRTRNVRRIQREIDSLRSQRKQIVAQIEEETKMEDDADHFPAHTAHERTRLPSKHRWENERNDEYAIEGVVRLASVGHKPPSKTQPTIAHPAIQLLPSDLFHPHCHQFGAGYRHDALQDVFSIQLKFAETMLQLEKSIQLRDRLLTSRSQGRRGRSSTTRHQSRRRRHQSTINEEREEETSGSEWDDETIQLASNEDSSDASLLRIIERYHRISRRHQPVAPTTTDTAASTPTTNSTSGSSPLDANRQSSCPGFQLGHQPTPTNDANFQTPTDAAHKQVRFRETPVKYGTPEIRRNLSFDQASVDSSDDEDHPVQDRRSKNRYKTHTTVSVSDDDALSFLEGSSVCSADLCDESFLLAFHALRQELKATDSSSFSWIKSNPSIGASLNDDDTAPTETEGKPAMESPATLQQRKRELTLDIQSLTAQLVLASDTSSRRHLQQELEILRRQLAAFQAPTHP